MLMAPEGLPLPLVVSFDRVTGEVVLRLFNDEEKTELGFISIVRVKVLRASAPPVEAPATTATTTSTNLLEPIPVYPRGLSSVV